MKRSIVAIVVVALVAVAVFGSQALADPPQSLPAPQFDGMAKVESYSGVVTISPDSLLTAVEETYPEARHVVLTVSLWNNSGIWGLPSDFAYVLDSSVEGPLEGQPVLSNIDLGYHTVEFVTKNWSIVVGYAATHVFDLDLNYKYIVTYPG
jgi:hypothetical protein